MHPEILKQNVIRAISMPEDAYLTTQDQNLIDAEIALHEDLLHSLTQRIAVLRNHRNSLSQAWCLPIEVLGNIMLVATDLAIKENNESDVYPTTLPVPLILGQVCAAWRNLAWQLPELWSTIPLAISKSCYDKQVTLLDEWLERAGEHVELYIILTLSRDETELQYWRDYPPKEILSRLYKRSCQWHTFYSTLPNLCLDIFATVYDRLPKLHTLILNRSGRLAYDPFMTGFPGGINNLAGGAPPAAGLVGPAVIQNGIVVPGQQGVQFMVQPANIPLAGINIDTENSRRKSPWFMLSKAPSLHTVVLPEALNPSEITLPWANITHLEVRTIPIDDSLRVLCWMPYIVSFNFHGIFTGPLSFYPTPHLHLAELRKFSVFADPANLSRFLEQITAPNLSSLEFKSTTGTLAPVTTQLTRLLQRSECKLTKLGICIPSIGRSESQITMCLMSEEMRGLEEVLLESWQVDVEGISDSFLLKMNPERRTRSVTTYSYLPVHSPGSMAICSPGEPVSDLESDDDDDDDDDGSDADAAIVPGWVDVPTDEIRDVVEEQVDVPEGEWVEPQEILLPNLLAMTYKGTLTFNPKILKDMIHARWRRKKRKRSVPTFVQLDNQIENHTSSTLGDLNSTQSWSIDLDQQQRLSSTEEVVIMEEEDWYPTAELTAFEIYAPETDFKDPIDEETNLVFREMLRGGFCLSIQTREGFLAF